MASKIDQSECQGTTEEKDISSAQREDLVSLVYDTALDPNLWPILLEKLGGVLSQEMFFNSLAEHRDNPTDDSSLNWLSPHMERAMLMGGKIYQMQAENRIFRDFLNRFPVSVAIVQSNGEIVAMNDSAQGLLQDSPLVSIKSNMFNFKNPVYTTKLHRLIRQVPTESLPPGVSTPYGSLKVVDQQQSLSLMVTSIRNISEGIQQDFSAVFITGIDSKNLLHTGAIGRIYNLTVAECRLLDALLGESHTIPEAARLLGISTHTARTQLKSIFSKISVSSQSELLKKIYTSPELMTLGSDEYGSVPVPLQQPELSGQSFQVLKLFDGRILEFAEYGDPEGVPVLFLHSAIFSRKRLHPSSDYVDTHGIRVIAPQRPGYGRSEMIRGMSLKDYASDVNQLLDYLQVKQCYVVAEGDGAPFALAYASMWKKRIKRMAIIASLAPPQFEKVEQMVSMDRLMHGLNRVAPFFAVRMLKMAIQGLKNRPESYFEKIYDEMHKSDQAVVDSTAHQEMWSELLDSITSENVDDFVENYLARLNQWDFSIEDIHVPTDIWHGIEDKRAPVEFARKLHEVIPDSRSFILEDQGHYLFFTHWDQILEMLIASPPIKT